MTGTAVEVLDELGPRISEGAPSDEILRLAADRLAAVLGGGCAIDLLTPEQTALVIGATGHADPAARAAMAAVSAPPRPVTPYLRAALGASDPQFFAGAAAQQLAGLIHPGHRAVLDDRRPEAGAWLPLACRGDVLGLMAAFRDPGDEPLSDPERRLLQRMAGMLGVVLERERTAARAALELRATRERAEAGEERFAALARTALDAIHIADDDAVVRWANDAAGELFGVPPDELVGQPLDRFVAEPDRAGFAGLWSGFIAKGHERGRYRVLRPDGTVRDVEFSAIANYVPGRHFAIVRDVTVLERDQRQGQLFAAVGDHIGPAIVSVDPGGVIATWNAGAERLLGHRAQDVIGRPIETVVPPDRRGEVARFVLTAARGATVGPVVTERLDVAGNPVAVELRVLPVRDADGQVTAVAAILEPATGAVAGVTTEGLRRVAERAEIGLWSVDAEGRTTGVNAHMAALLGLAPDGVAGRPMADFVAADDVVPDAPRPPRERVLRRPDGAEVHVSVVSTPLPPPEAGALHVVSDLSRRHVELVALHEAAEHDRRVLDAAARGIFVLTPGGVVTFANRAAAEFLGRPAEAMAGITLEDLGLDERTLATVREKVARHAAGESAQYELPFAGRDMLISGGPLLGADGTVEAVVAVTADVTELRAAERAERRAAARKRAILASLAEAVVVVAPDGTVETANDAVARVLGVEPSALTGADFDAALPGAFHAGDGGELAPADRPWARALRTGQPDPWRIVRFTRPDGAERWLTTAARPLAGDARPGGAVVATFADVSAGVAGRPPAADFRRRLDTAVEGLPDPFVIGVAVRDPAGTAVDFTLEYANAAAAAQRGMTADELTGRRLTDLFPELCAAGLLDACRATLATGRLSTLDGIAVTTDDRIVRHLDVRVSALDDGVMVGWIDATERAGAEAERVRLAGQLQRTYRVLVGTNEALMRIRDRETLFDELCRVAVEEGGLRMAWIGVVDRGAGVVRPVAQAGVRDGYVDALLIPLDPRDRRAQGPTGTAVLSGEPVVVDDIATDHRMLPWRAEALRRGYRSSATFPLRCDGEVIGNLNLYASEPAFFGAEELQLLEQLVADINLGLGALRHEQARHDAELAVRTAEERYRTLFERAAEGIFISRRDGRFITVNPAFARMFGYEEPEDLMRELTATDLYRHAADRERLLDALARHGRATEFEVEGWRRDGAPVWVRLEVLAHRDEAGQIVSLQGMALDVTESHVATDRLSTSEQRLQAIVDNLPALVAVSEIAEQRYLIVNRAFEEAFGLARGEAAGRTDADVLPGDVALATRALSRRALGIRQAVTEERPLSLDGEERTYLWTAFPLVGGGDVPYATCVVATDITDRKRAEEQLRERVRWSDRIGRALREGRMVAVAQPIVDLRTGEALCEELLVRLRDADDPERLIEPADFLPAAERHGLIADIDRFMVDRAIERAQASGRCVEVNLSAVTLGDPRVTGAIADRVARARLAPGALVFEITETAAIGAMDAATAFAEQVKALGCGLALDDFGTGFGAMTYLRRLRPDYMKIDRSFVVTMTRSEDDRTIVRTVVSIARELGMRTIAEGVEDAETLAELQEMGVDLAQGFHLGRPVPVD